MLEFVGKGQPHTCDGMTRRDFLHVGALAAIGLSLPHYLWAKDQGALQKGKDDRSAILIFNLGAPSQLDTFDPKPDAPAEVRGPFRPIPTKVPGMQVAEILPRHAQVADKFALVRSCSHTAAAVHDAGWQMMQTGRLFTGGVNAPHVGAAVSYLRGRRTDLPAHVVLPAVASRAAGSSAVATRSAAPRRSGRPTRPRWSPRSSTAWGSTSRPICPARRAGRSPWSISASTRSRSCSNDPLHVRRRKRSAFWPSWLGRRTPTGGSCWKTCSGPSSPAGSSCSITNGMVRPRS